MKKISLLGILCFLAINLFAQSAQIKEVKPFYQGTVTEAHHAGGYSYLRIKEKTNKTFWIAVNKADVKSGTYVRFQKELIAKNFDSKALNRSFDEIMFAVNLQYKIKE